MLLEIDFSNIPRELSWHNKKPRDRAMWPSLLNSIAGSNGAKGYNECPFGHVGIR